MNRIICTGQSTRSFAEFKGVLKRGTENILSSPHFTDVRQQYMRNRLKANFYGPREWYLITRNKMKRKSPSEIAAVANSIQSEDHKVPGEYPFISKEMLADDGSFDMNKQPSDEHKDLWEQYRLICANLYPASDFAIEERIIDAWNYFQSGDYTRLQVPKFTVYGGFVITLRDKYARRYPELDGKPENVSDQLYDLYLQIRQSCNPFKSSEAAATLVGPDALRELTGNGSRLFQTEEDVKIILPRIVESWRHLCMGNVKGGGYQTPDSTMTDALIRLACDLGSPETALHMIRHKPVYKLAPSVKSVEYLMQKLFERYSLINSSIDEIDNSDKSTEEEPPVDTSKFLPKGKRKLSRREFPFRQGPRFYFYNKLPFVLNPEPSSRFSEIEMPKLPTDNETKRLLPDDKRKKLAMMIAEEEYNLDKDVKANKQNELTEALLDVLRLFVYATTESPFYYGLATTESMSKLLKHAEQEYEKVVPTPVDNVPQA